ncbi:NAD(P)-binding protein [Lepidopterella palustris CBS 459.81]|uniref:NAD(P)-binding protein n=1 Tax=Lepidopterella palustris CBS 459.81 TaxID=1314670 RepID=A0A8E2JAK8_9PEZI|nr:NAD(P)-binding protein [Lepidopterella palustris CBS 459.81]
MPYGPVGDFDLNGKIVLITGGGSGIHLELGKLVLADGAKVLIADQNLTPEAEEFVKANSGTVIFQKCNVAKWAELKNLIKVSEEKFGDVPDVYVAGAGVFEPPWSNFWDDNEDERYACIEINVNHPLKLTRIAMTALLSKNKKGVVAIMASITGYTGTYSAPMYCTTKHALIGFTRSIGDADRLEGVKVVTIAPGIVKTPLWHSRPDIMARYGYSDEIAMPAIDVAKGYMKIIKEGKYPGGTIFETSLAGERTIDSPWFIAPPGYDPNNPVEGTGVPQEALDRSYQPIIDTLKAERGTGMTVL